MVCCSSTWKVKEWLKVLRILCLNHEYLDETSCCEQWKENIKWKTPSIVTRILPFSMLIHNFSPWKITGDHSHAPLTFTVKCSLVPLTTHTDYASHCDDSYIYTTIMHEVHNEEERYDSEKQPRYYATHFHWTGKLTVLLLFSRRSVYLFWCWVPYVTTFWGEKGPKTTTNTREEEWSIYCTGSFTLWREKNLNLILI